MFLEDFKNRVLPIKDKLYRFALKYMKDDDEAKDAVQEVFFKLWRKKDEMHSYINMEAWCMRLTRNYCLDRLKSKAYRSSGNHEFDLQDKARDPYKNTELNDTMNKIYRLIEQLPDKQKDIIHLRDVEGYSYQEISEILQLDINQVKVNLFRARKYLREKLINAEAYGL